MTNDTNDISTLQDVEQLAASRGIRFTKADYAKIRKSQAEARKTIEADRAAALERESTWADKFMRWYPKLLNSIASAGNIVITFSQAVIVNLGVPVVLILLLIVEQQRVLHGIQLFEINLNLASFAAWSMVILNLCLEIIAHHVEYTHDYHAERGKKWSARIWVKNMAYRLGLGDNWSVQELSPAQWAHNLLRIVTFTILALALAGSMRVVIEQQSGAWYTALYSIVTQSSLLDILTWLGGLLFAAAAVLSAQGLSRYVAIRTVEIRRDMVTDDSDLTEQLDNAAATAAYAILVEKVRKERMKAGEPVTVNPTIQPVPVMMEAHTNGNGKH